jgi:hypothetical protein
MEEHRTRDKEGILIAKARRAAGEHCPFTVKHLNSFIKSAINHLEVSKETKTSIENLHLLPFMLKYYRCLKLKMAYGYYELYNVR